MEGIFFLISIFFHFSPHCCLCYTQGTFLLSSLTLLETLLWEAMTEWVHMHYTQSAMVVASKMTNLAQYIFKYFECIITGTLQDLLTNPGQASCPSPATKIQFSDLSQNMVYI